MLSILLYKLVSRHLEILLQPIVPTPNHLLSLSFLYCIGIASMTVPVYIAEASPPHLRGQLVTVNTLFITGGQFTASLIDGAFSYLRHDGWRSDTHWWTFHIHLSPPVVIELLFETLDIHKLSANNNAHSWNSVQGQFSQFSPTFPTILVAI